MIRVRVQSLGPNPSYVVSSIDCHTSCWSWANELVYRHVPNMGNQMTNRAKATNGVSSGSVSVFNHIPVLPRASYAITMPTPADSPMSSPVSVRAESLTISHVGSDLTLDELTSVSPAHPVQGTTPEPQEASDNHLPSPRTKLVDPEFAFTDANVEIEVELFPFILIASSDCSRTCMVVDD